MGLNPFKGADLYDLEDNISRFLKKGSKGFSHQLARFFSSIHRRGRQKITLMFIPHSEKKIINFHISYYAIVITLAVFSATITATTILIVNHTSTIKDITRLKMSGYDSTQQIALYKTEINQLYDAFQQFKPELTYMFSLTPDNDVDSLWAKGGPQTPEDQIPPAMREAPDLELLDVQEMAQELATTKEVLKKVKVFLANRKKIIENTPSIWPVDGYVVAGFGSSDTDRAESLNGVDIVAFPGAEVRATAPGTVETVDWDPEQGITVVIKHKYGFTTVFSHCQRVTVKPEQKVIKGETIGYIGKTGNAMRHMLHYQIRIGTDYVDPSPYLNRLYQME